MKITCPTCRDESKPVARSNPFFPFCSRACKEHDLDNWVEEKYRVEGKQSDDNVGDDDVDIDWDGVGGERF